MKKLIIGALVGSLILFFWQFFSWSLLNVHASNMDYTPQQEAILQSLADNNVAEGEYFLPRAPIGSSVEQEQEFMNKQVGKPWALITYHKSMEHTMAMNMFRGWVIDFLVAFLLCWIILKMIPLDFPTALMTTLAIGFIGYLTISYLNSIWFQGNSIPYLIDTVVAFGVMGCWLGYWLPRK